MPLPIQKFREIVFQLLYSYDLGKSSDENMLDLISKELAVTKKNVKEAQARTQQIIAQLAEIDQAISDTSISYDFERIQSVERNILRIGTYELLFDDSIPFKVSISEAMRLTRKFSTKEAAVFVNAILDALHKKKHGEKIDQKLLDKSAEELAESEKLALEVAKNPPQQPDSVDEEL